MTPDQLDAIRVVAYAVDTYANAVEDIRALLAYVKELEANAVALRWAIASDLERLHKQIAPLEAALDWMMMQETGWYHKDPIHLAPILEASRKRINGSDKT